MEKHHDETGQEVKKQFLNEREVSLITGKALSTLRNARSKRTGIPYSKDGRSVRYYIEDIYEYMGSCRIQTRPLAK